ncbi:MAG: FecR domain-containing protein [Alistipes sp.]|jgi:ferric-dicitrate binding protein FerR (iron transport regulator)|nr:FecR domain-containing protein [Alistipes sp.]
MHKISRNGNKNRYTAYDLLQDDEFIASQLRPSRESEERYREMIGRGALTEEDFMFAREFVLSTRVAPVEMFDKEMFEMWAGIEVANKAGMRRAGMRLRMISLVSGVAATLAMALIVADGALKDSEAFPPLMAADEALAAGADVKLYLDDERSLSFGGSEVNIEYDGKSITVGGNEVVMAGELADIDGSDYHQLVVPKGKRSRMTLPDGSVVWVNAGSRIAFPGKFDRRRRELYVDGRAYLEVTPDNRRPFSVKTTRMSVEVLGTSFDIDAYNDISQRVVLVDGSVKVRGAGDRSRETVLVPDEMYSLSNGISKVSEVNAQRLVSWKDGLLYYSSETLGAIAADLSQYYGLTIVCSREAAPMRFSGKLDLKDRLETILDGLSKSTSIAYGLSGSTYVITDKLKY